MGAMKEIAEDLAHNLQMRGIWQSSRWSSPRQARNDRNGHVPLGAYRRISRSADRSRLHELPRSDLARGFGKAGQVHRDACMRKVFSDKLIVQVLEVADEAGMHAVLIREGIPPNQGNGSPTSHHITAKPTPDPSGIYAFGHNDQEEVLPYPYQPPTMGQNRLPLNFCVGIKTANSTPIQIANLSQIGVRAIIDNLCDQVGNSGNADILGLIGSPQRSVAERRQHDSIVHAIQINQSLRRDLLQGKALKHSVTRFRTHVEQPDRIEPTELIVLSPQQITQLSNREESAVI